jgi:hypothetical protein
MNACSVAVSIPNIRTTASPIVLGLALAGRRSKHTEHTDHAARGAPCSERRPQMKNSVRVLTFVVFRNTAADYELRRT